MDVVRRPMPQMPCRHVAGWMAGPLEVAIGPMDLGRRGAGAVEGHAGGPVEEHVIGVFRGGRFSHGSGGCRGKSSFIGYPDFLRDLG